MTSQSVNPVTSIVFTNDKGGSTDKNTENQTVNHTKKKKGIGVATGWLRMVEPRKVPYFPQKKDKIVYLQQAHECYLKEVNERKIFDVKETDKLWVQMKMDDDIEYLTVVNVSFKKYPTRVACLEVRKINKEEEAIGPNYKLRYHDMGDVVDFLVLKHIFNEGLKMKWNVGDRFRYLVGNKWFFGTIKSIEPFEKKYPNSPFKSFKIKWDSKIELDELSPWEVQNLNKSRLPKNHGESVEVLNIEIVKMRYKPSPDDWPEWKDWKANIKKIVDEFDLLMNLPISKCFIDIKNDPVYDALVLYPIDLSTIRERLDKYFYRRIDSLLMDVFHLKANAEKHKPEKLGKEAKLITEVCEEIVNKGGCDNTSLTKLNDFLKNFNSSESEDDDNEYKPFGSSNKKGRNSNYKNNWKIGCKELLTTLWESEDMLVFRQPVCREDYPDYYEVISSPICLEEINAKFISEQYESPKEFFGDIKLLITNSKKYNKDQARAIYHATARVSALFDELKKQINCRKDNARTKFKKNQQKKSELDVFIPMACKGKPKYSPSKTNGESIICTIAQNASQQKDPAIKKTENESVVDEKRIDSKNNNCKNDLTDNETNFEVEMSNLTPAMQNEGTEVKSGPKKNVKENLVHSMELDDSSYGSKNLPQETQSVNPNEDFRMETDEGEKTNNGNSSGFDSDGCEIVYINSSIQTNLEPKSPQISQSKSSENREAIIMIDSDNDDEKESSKVTKSVEKANDCTQSQLHDAENRDKDVNDSSQKKSNFKKSLASIKAKKRMQFQYNRIFHTRPCKSCVTCQNIKQIFLDHLKSHQF